MSDKTESVMGGFCKKWCDFRRGFIAEKSEKPKTFLKPEGSPVLQLHFRLTIPYVSIFCEACSKEHCGKR